ncbi:flagellar hook-associated protein FlgK [Bacillus sp. AK128]
MVSTFHGLETARRGMTTQQQALYVTGHNISNANTPGYSRQRVNFEQTESYPAPSTNSPMIPGQIGTGVKAGSIQRVRDQFLDSQYRSENNKLGYWDNRSNGIQQMEDILNEPSEDGLAATLDRFWSSLQDLAVQPEDSGARSVVRQRAISVTETFQYYHNSLDTIRKDLQKEIGTSEDEVNTLLRQINGINKQIGQIEPHGYLPNDLYDERDRLVDQLSQLVNVRMEKVPSGGMANGLAEGKLNIYLADPQGGLANGPVKLVDGQAYTNLSIKANYQDPTVSDSPVSSISFLDEAGDTVHSYSASEFVNKTSGINGKINALVEMYGYQNGAFVKGEYPEMLDSLDKMAYTFAVAFNAQHAAGESLKEISNPGTLDNFGFFTLTIPGAPANDWQGASKTIAVSNEIQSDTDFIAASFDGNAGDGTNAYKLAEVKDLPLSYTNPSTTGGETKSLQGFYQEIIGRMGVNGIESNRMKNNATTLRDTVQYNRDSVSNVSLDEEMTNMIKFQHAYNAAARNITAVDEILDKIINGMGLVGR